MFAPIVRAISQLDDPVFVGVMLRGIAWSIACFIGLHAGVIWVIHHSLDLHGWLAGGADILGAVAASLLSLWLFLPVAAAIGTLYFDRIAAAVEHRYYPELPPPRGASLIEQALDGGTVALKILALNIVALILALLIPGLGLILGWMIAAYAIGRGLFVTIAMRRMSRPRAEFLYRQFRGLILGQGAILALAAYIPVLNLLIPIVGAACMVHILDTALSPNEGFPLRLV